MSRLLTQTQSLYDSTITIDIVHIEILQQLATTAYHLCQRTGCAIVLVVLLQVLCEVLDAEGEQGNLALSRTRVGSILAILSEDLLLLCLIEIHNFLLINNCLPKHSSDALPP